MGGDRDGNPNVTSNITNRIILLTRWEAATLYEKEFTKIIQKLSMHECSKNLRRKNFAASTSGFHILTLLCQKN